MSATLLIANDGGHIMQLRSLVDRFPDVGQRVWATVPTAQTESLLEGERVHWMAEAPTRDWRAVIRNAAKLRAVLRGERFERAISTGSSLALSGLPLAALRRIPAHYIESVTRTHGLSMSGRILQRVPGVSLYVQWPQLAQGRWRFGGSVLDGFEAVAGEPGSVRRIVVSLGTSGRYGFRRLVERLAAVVPDDVDVLWQTGSTDVSGLAIDARPNVPAQELTAAIERADVLIAHAGAGIALTGLHAGKVPLLAPRSAARGEHVDDHQAQIAESLARLGLAVVVDADDVSWEHVTAMTARRAVATEAAAPFVLAE